MGNVNLCVLIFFIAYFRHNTAHWKDAKIKERMLGVATFSTGGAVSGQVAFSPDQAKEIVSRNDSCILVLRETHPGQEELLQVRVYIFFIYFGDFSAFRQNGSHN